MTNPRTPTAHRWVTADLAAQTAQSMGELSHIASSSSQCSTHKEYYSECFYNKDGKWYYAGAYKAFRLDDLSVSEWEKLSTEVTKPILICVHVLYQYRAGIASSHQGNVDTQEEYIPSKRLRN